MVKRQAELIDSPELSPDTPASAACCRADKDIPVGEPRALPSAGRAGNFDTGYGNASLPLLAPDGHAVAAGAPFGSFGIKLWTLP